MLQKLTDFFAVYRDRKMLAMLALGFASGFPFPLVFNTLSLWLKFDSLSLEIIGIFSLSKLPYSFKWLWAPLIDKIRLPLLGSMGQRRSWALFAQILIAVAVIALAFSSPAENYLVSFGLAVFLAVSSATLDIALDAYRVENFPPAGQAAASASFVTGYRLGFLFSGAGALYLAEIFDWNVVYLLMSLGTLVGIATICRSPEPQNSRKQPAKTYRGFSDFFQSAAIAPLKDFIRHQNWQLILLFVFFYRMSDAYISPMAYVFYKDIGFDYKDIASITKVFGVLATIGGVFIGGPLLSRVSLNKGLVICGILQTLSNLTYAVQAHVGANPYMLMVTIFVENVSGGMGTAAFMAYIASLCNIAYTATQYALLSSLMSLARDGLSATSGWMAQTLGWGNFFVFSTLIGFPGLIILFILIRLQNRTAAINDAETRRSDAKPRRQP